MATDLAQHKQNENTLVVHASRYARNARSPNTMKAYESDLNAFGAWCDQQRTQPIPCDPRALCLYLTHMADEGLAPSTIDRALAAISQAHRHAGFPSPRTHPAVADIRRGIRRLKGVSKRQRAPALQVAHLRAMCLAQPDTLLGIRNRALLVVGFAGGFRRSELVELEVEDIQFEPDGIRCHISRGKTDQEGEGRDVGLPYGSVPATCPVRTLQSWIAAVQLTRGPLFRSLGRAQRLGGRLSAGQVSRIVKACAIRAQVPKGAKYSGHSLRAGLATAAAQHGKSTASIMAQTGHRSVSQVVEYVRAATIFQDNAASGIGL
jgi:site-specific recombinase XerD